MELLPAHVAHSKRRHAKTNAEPPRRSHPRAHPQVMLIPLQSEVSFHPTHPREALSFLLQPANTRRGGGWRKGGREEWRKGGWELAGREGGREDLAARPIASARFVMSQDLVGLASTSSSRGQCEWETQRRLLSNERSRSAATCHLLFGWVNLFYILSLA